MLSQDIAMSIFDGKLTAALARSRLARNSAWLMAGQSLSLVLQAGYFFVLARILERRGYGNYVVAGAFCSILSQYSNNGAGTLFLRYVSIDHHEHGRYFGNILLSVLGLGGVVVLLLWLLAPHFVSAESAALVLVVALGECICRQLTDAVAKVFQAYEEMKATAALSLLMNVLRFLVAAGMLVTMHHATPRAWAVASVLVSAAGTAAIVLMAATRFGGPRLEVRLFFRRFAEGFGFSFAGSTFSIYNDIDKTMLSHYGMNLANGLYTMAYRAIDIASMPGWSIYAAMLPRLFQAGHKGIASSRPLARQLLAAILAFSATGGVLLFALAPLIPRIVGASFAGSVEAVRWLCLLPVLRSFQLSAGGALTGAGYQRYRTMAQLGAAVVNFGLNLYLIPHYSWRGAAWASLLTDGLIGGLNWAMFLALSFRERKNSAALEVSLPA
jgi:O-antigen/teichoic acid export membrane protein